MQVNPNQKTTKLGTDLTFEVVDMRGERGFPRGQKGLAFRHQERRTIHCKFTGVPINRKADYVIQTDHTGKGWRIDHHEGFGLKTAVYGPNREDYFPSHSAAASALKAHLDEIEHNSSIGG